MSEDALHKLIDDLKENGVSAKVSELKGGKNGEIQKVLGISVKLDFSEHDSMLKGEIEKLKSELEYEKRNMNYLRTRCMEDATDAFDNRAYGRLTIVGRRVDLEAESDKLNQRIAELEKSRSEWIDKTVEWQQKCEKLEIKEAENTVCVRVSASPIEIATHLINNTCTINELKMIAEHINVYCNGGK